MDSELFYSLNNNLDNPLNNILPKIKHTKYNCKKESMILPKVNTEQYKAISMNRSSFIILN